MSILSNAIKRRIKYLNKYQHPLFWLFSFYDAFIRSVKYLKLPFWGRGFPVKLKDHPHPFYLRLGRSDWFVFEEVFLEKIYHEIFSFGLKGMKTIVDLGANVGYTARLWNHNWPDAQVFSLEPDSQNFHMCQINLKHLRQVRLIHACIVGHKRPVQLKSIGIDSSIQMVEINAPGTGRPVLKIYTMAHLIADFKIRRIDLLKCDIEGTEVELFKDCRPWIQSVRNIVIELHPPYAEKDLLGDINRNGGQFRCHRLTCSGGQIFYLRRIDDESSGMN